MRCGRLGVDVGKGLGEASVGEGLGVRCVKNKVK